MRNQHKGKGRKGATRRHRKGDNMVPDSGMVHYKGPIKMPMIATDGVVVNLREQQTQSTGATGSFVFYDTNNPSSADNWSEYSTAWTEYRVLGVSYRYIPTYKVNTAVISDAPLVMSVLHEAGVPAPTSITEAYSYGQPKLTTLMRESTVQWRMSSSDESQFLSTASPSGTGYTLLFSTFGGSASITYGYLFYTYLVQFRSPRK